MVVPETSDNFDLIPGYGIGGVLVIICGMEEDVLFVGGESVFDAC